MREAFIKQLAKKEGFYKTSVYLLATNKPLAKSLNKKALKVQTGDWDGDFARYNFQSFKDPQVGLAMIENELSREKKSIFASWVDMARFAKEVKATALLKKCLEKWYKEIPLAPVFNFEKEILKPARIFLHEFNMRSTAISLKNRILLSQPDDHLELARFYYWDLNQQQTALRLMQKAEESSSSRLLSLPAEHTRLWRISRIYREMGFERKANQVFASALPTAFSRGDLRMLSCLPAEYFDEISPEQIGAIADLKASINDESKDGIDDLPAFLRKAQSMPANTRSLCFNLLLKDLRECMGAHTLKEMRLDFDNKNKDNETASFLLHKKIKLIVDYYKKNDFGSNWLTEMVDGNFSSIKAPQDYLLALKYYVGNSVIERELITQFYKKMDANNLLPGEREIFYVREMSRYCYGRIGNTAAYKLSFKYFETLSSFDHATEFLRYCVNRNWENKFENFLVKNFSSVKLRLKIPLKLSWKGKKEKLFFQETLKKCRSTEDYLHVCRYYLSKNNPAKAKDFYQKARSAASFSLDYAQLAKHHFVVTNNLAVAEKYLDSSMRILFKTGRRPQELLHQIEGLYRYDLYKDKKADRVRDWLKSK